jgi:endo-1,4-beta-xylanase
MKILKADYLKSVYKIQYFTIVLTLIITNSCKSKITDPVIEKGLKDYYQDYFPIGCSVTPSSLIFDEGALLKKEFNSLTAEHVMKMSPLHPTENSYKWTDADMIVSFAQDNGMKIRGHTLVWHSQTPSWILLDSVGKTVTKDVLLRRLKDYITTVVTRYKGKVYAWDVVNEAIDDDNTKTYRQTPWYTICGEEYIAKAFQWAHEADPDALLFYNDYNTESSGKRDRIYNMLKKLLDAGVPVHGIGLQGHWSIDWPSETDIRSSITKYSSLGIKVQITELDISAYSSSADFSVRKSGDDTFTSSMELMQIDKYKMIFRVFRENKNVITGVTFWNISDRKSWLDNFPVANRKNYPLLFDKELKPKKAYWEVVNF